MFIEHDSQLLIFAPAGAKRLLLESDISLLRSVEVSFRSPIYKHFSALRRSCLYVSDFTPSLNADRTPLGGYIMSLLKTIIISAIILLIGCSVPTSQIEEKRASDPKVKTQGQNPEPEKVTPCQLMNDPATYNHKLVEVTGFFSHGFENSTVTDPGCASRSIWLEYGGTTATGTMICCGVSAERTRPEPIVVEDIPIPLVDDEQFRKFDKLVQSKPDRILRSTVIGRFFSGTLEEFPGGKIWVGYGHFGMHSLLVLQQVLWAEPPDRDDLDYRVHPDSGYIGNGCDYEVLTPRETGSISLETQKRTEQDETRVWAFDDPRRVASDALAGFLKFDEKSITGLKQSRKAQGRFVYEWRNKTQGQNTR
jgi:hypothetical protein